MALLADVICPRGCGLVAKYNAVERTVNCPKCGYSARPPIPTEPFMEFVVRTFALIDNADGYQLRHKSDMHGHDFAKGMSAGDMLILADAMIKANALVFRNAHFDDA